MDIELVKCECCGLKEDCTQEYIAKVKSSFGGKWLCGLCSEAARDEFDKAFGMDEAVRAHMSFCRKSRKSNPAIRVADGMREILRRRTSGLTTSANSSSSSKNKYSRSSSAAGQVGNHGSPAVYYC